MTKKHLFTAAALVLAATACSPEAAHATASTSHSGNALTTLNTLSVKGSGPMTGYSRNQFGKAWTDDTNDLWGHNGCDTRDDILRRDMSSKVLGKVSSCEHANMGIKYGVLHDPYTNTVISMTRGVNSTAIQIDHIVPLGNAWISGAKAWSLTQRTAYANDPLVLVSAQGAANEQKGDSNAASWLPSNKAFRPCYVARQIEVKAKYHLSVTPAEKATMLSILKSAPATNMPNPTAASNHC